MINDSTLLKPFLKQNGILMSPRKNTLDQIRQFAASYAYIKGSPARSIVLN